MGVVTPVPLRTYPDGFPDEIIEQLIDAHRPRRPLQPALQRHRGDRRLRRAAPRDRRPDRLHVGRLGAADRRARRRGAARRALRGLRRRARDHDAASTPSAASSRGRSAASRARSSAPTGRKDLALAAARAAPTWRSCRPPASRCTRSARSGRCSTASASTVSTRARPTPTAIAATARADRRARRRLRVHQPRRDRPGLRPPRRRRRASTARCRRSTPRSAAGSSASTRSATCWSSPPTTAATRPRPGTDHTREHAPLLARFAGHGGRRHDGPFADVGASALRWLAGRDAPGCPARRSWAEPRARAGRVRARGARRSPSAGCGGGHHRVGAADREPDARRAQRAGGDPRADGAAS